MRAAYSRARRSGREIGRARVGEQALDRAFDILAVGEPSDKVNKWFRSLCRFAEDVGEPQHKPSEFSVS
jgi:hypothetical protein